MKIAFQSLCSASSLEQGSGDQTKLLNHDWPPAMLKQDCGWVIHTQTHTKNETNHFLLLLLPLFPCFKPACLSLVLSILLLVYRSVVCWESRLHYLPSGLLAVAFFSTLCFRTFQPSRVKSRRTKPVHPDVRRRVVFASFFSPPFYRWRQRSQSEALDSRRTHREVTQFFPTNEPGSKNPNFSVT